MTKIELYKVVFDHHGKVKRWMQNTHKNEGVFARDIPPSPHILDLRKKRPELNKLNKK